MRFHLSAFLAASLAASSRAQDFPNAEVCTIKEDQDCNYAFLKANLPDNKQYWMVMPGGETKCIDGSPYGFQVFPGDTNKLFYWFQGGGGCFNHFSCVVSPTAVTSFLPEESGIFDMEAEGNPLVEGGWTTVINNLCTGDANYGNTAPLLSSNDGTKSATVFLNGLKNTQAVMDWITSQPEFPPEEEIIAGGGGGGSLSVQAYFNYLVDTLGADRLLADSFVGFLAPTSNAVLQLQDACSSMTDRGIPPYIQSLCLGGNIHLIGTVTEDFLRNNPDVPFAYIGSTADEDQIFFYAVTTNAAFEGDLTTLSPGFTYANLNFARFHKNQLGYYKDLSNEFSSYVVDVTKGSGFLSFDGIYSDPTFNAPNGKQTMLEFASEFINGPATKPSKQPTKKAPKKKKKKKKKKSN